MKVRFLINPRAGKSKISSLIRRLGENDYVITKDRQNTILQTQKDLKEGYEHIIAVGGDGTLNAVVNGFFENGVPINPNATLGVTNEGTGCDYFRSLEVPRGDWMKLVTEFSPRLVDVGCIEFIKQKLKPIYFINVASVGMSAEVVAKRSFGYILSTLKVLPFFKPKKMRINFNGKELEDEFINIFIAKGKTAGGGLRLGGNVALDDGMFDVTCIHGMPLLKSLTKFPALFTGNFGSDPAFTKIKTKQIELHSPEKLPVEFDGEIFGTTNVRFSVVPRCIQVAIPKLQSN